MFKKIQILAILAISMSCVGQNTTDYTNLSAWNSPEKNWETVGTASGAYNADRLTTSAGNGILHCKSKAEVPTGKDIYSNFTHGDVKISMDFMLPKGSNSGIYLQGQYEVQVYDSWGVKVPKQHDCGAIYERWDPIRGKGKEGFEGHPPKQNANLAPGIWQHIDIHFLAPKFNDKAEKIENAKFVSVKLNGVELHKNVVVLAPTRGADAGGEKAFGPLRLQGDHGEVAFRNIQIEVLDKKPVIQSEVSYKYFEGKFDKIPEVIPTKTMASGVIDKINYRVAEKNSDFLIEFKGTLDVPEAAEYQISLPATGIAKLIIDNTTVLDKGIHLWRNEANSTNLQLNQGKHNYKLYYARSFSWGGRALGLYLKRHGAEAQSLHEYISLPDPDPQGLIEVKAGVKPVIQRSFVYHNDAKRTHALNMAFPQGLNMSYDLDKGAILQIWKGRFLNATDMWFERGEPQTSAPLGVAITLNGKNLIGQIGDNSQMPDSLIVNKEWTYKGYKLNEAGVPTFNYKYNNQIINDKFEVNPDGNGLLRTISIPDFQNVTIRLAEATQIQDLHNGSYIADNHYITTSSGADTKIVKFENGYQLLAKPSSSTFIYNLIW